MGVEVDILTAGMQRMSSYTTALPIAWPGTGDGASPSFTPPSSGMWIEVDHFPNDPGNIAWGNDAPSERIGSFGFSVYFETGKGIFAAKREAESIAAHFAKGTVLGPVIVEREPSIARHVVDGSKGFIPVTVNYRGIA